MKLFAVAAAVLCATAAADEMVQGMAAEAGAGSSEQAYWLPPASGGMVGGPPQGGGGGGGGGGMGGPGGSPQMQATPSSPYTSAYSVQPQAFYNFIEERAAQQQQQPRAHHKEATLPTQFLEQGMGAEEGAGSSEQAYWLPPASGGMVGGPPQGGGGGGGGGGMGGPGGSPQMQATPSSPYTSAYSVQPQAFYNFIEERAAQQQQMQHQQLQAAMQQGYGQQVAPPQGPNQFYYIHNAHPETYMQNANRFSEKRSAYRSRQSRRHPSTSAYKKKRNAHKVVGHHSRFAHVATLVEKTHNNQHTHAKAHKDIKHFKKNLKKHAGATQRFKEMVHSAHNKAKR